MSPPAPRLPRRVTWKGLEASGPREAGLCTQRDKQPRLRATPSCSPLGPLGGRSRPASWRPRELAPLGRAMDADWRAPKMGAPTCPPNLSTHHTDITSLDGGHGRLEAQRRGRPSPPQGWGRRGASLGSPPKQTDGEAITRPSPDPRFPQLPLLPLQLRLVPLSGVLPKAATCRAGAAREPRGCPVVWVFFWDFTVPGSLGQP